MLIDIHGNTYRDEVIGINTVYVNDDEKLYKAYRVSVIKGTIGNYKRIADVDFENYPSDDQIMWAIKKHGGDFANVNRVYHSSLPFEDGPEWYTVRFMDGGEHQIPETRLTKFLREYCEVENTSVEYVRRNH